MSGVKMVTVSRPLAFACIFLMVIAGVASAYELSIYAPPTVQKGKPLVVNGTSNIPAGISVDIVLSRSEYTTEEIERKTVTIQSDKEFSVVFDTKDLRKGQYKVEVPSIQGYAFLGGSVTLRVVQVIDRSDEVTIRSPRTQELDGPLVIAGTIQKNRGTGVQMEVIGPGNEVVFGPLYIPTSSDGSFSQSVQVREPGTYEVSFTDNKGYIGTYTFNVTRKAEAPATPATPAPTELPLSATAAASGENPAYFTVTGIKGRVKVATSPGIDWVVEYAGEGGAVQKVNSRGQLEPEEVTVESPGNVVYLKVYPYLLSDRGEVTVFVEGAEKIGVAREIPPVFAPTKTPTQKSPFPLAALLTALLLFPLRKVTR
ncbi:MAG: hypothetical protein QFX32_03195 [Methanolinea sp.]|nr:hypothetical protein [Methanolinea sp.]